MFRIFLSFVCFILEPNKYISDHTYTQSEPTVEKVKTLKEQVENLVKSRKNLAGRKRRLETKINISNAIDDANIQTSDAALKNLKEKAKSIPGEIAAAISKRLKYSEKNDNSKTYRTGLPYSKELQEFSLSLHNVSPSGYSYVREALDNILPSESTILKWMKKIDGSPGFTQQVSHLGVDTIGPNTFGPRYNWPKYI